MEALYETIISSLVRQLGGEARIPQVDLEHPLELQKDDDPITGDWIYRTTPAEA